MSKDKNSRRSFIANAAATTGLVVASSIVPTRFSIGATSKIKIGILLPYSGTYAMLGNSITNAMKMRIEQAGGRMGGRLVEYVALDSEMSVPKAPQNIYCPQASQDDIPIYFLFSI